MSRKHYCAMAAILKAASGRHSSTAAKAALREMAEEMAREFARDNGRFDRGRFLRASGVEETAGAKPQGGKP